MGGAMGESDKTPRRSTKKARCAIYTRKSSEEGLEQAFNSLDVQREACAAFILSQKHEGWTVLPGLYDDGGFSGGTMERPALKRLMHTVTVTEDGFEYAGTSYPPLTKIAKRITGAHWSGPRFFGLLAAAAERPSNGGRDG